MLPSLQAHDNFAIKDTHLSLQFRRNAGKIIVAFLAAVFLFKAEVSLFLLRSKKVVVVEDLYVIQ